MKSKTHTGNSQFEDPTTDLGSIFDSQPVDEADLWFLQDQSEDAEAFGSSPLPRADRRQLFDAADWRRAQGDLSAELAQLCMRFGMLNERLGRMGQGACQRLAMREASEFSWWAGERVSIERLSLWLGARIGGGLDESLALSKAGWAVRRLTAGLAPGDPNWLEGAVRFLGYDHLTPSIEELAEVMRAARDMHPVTQSAILFHAWRMIGQGAATDAESHALAACHGASMLGPAPKHAATYLPLIAAGFAAARASGAAKTRLASWIFGAEQAVFAALMQLEQLENWHRNATLRVAALSGRTPQRLVELFFAWPMVTAPMAEAQSNSSRAAVQRNLDLLTSCDLIREITGQGRYRVWVAKL